MRPEARMRRSRKVAQAGPQHGGRDGVGHARADAEALEVGHDDGAVLAEGRALPHLLAVTVFICKACKGRFVMRRM